MADAAPMEVDDKKGDGKGSNEDEQQPDEKDAKQLEEFRAKAQRMADARAAMMDSERVQCEAVAKMLAADFHCRHCKDVLLEPWIVKDCGHLYCYDCLFNLVEQKTRHCPACGAGSSAEWSTDPFGWFSVAQLADGSRRVIRDGAKFVYDDSVDSLVRLLWPNRIEEYVRVDIDRERRRIEDATARETFEKEVQDDRLAQPSSANPNMASGRLPQRRAPLNGSGSLRDSALARRSSAGGAELRPPRVSLPPPKVVVSHADVDRLTRYKGGGIPRPSFDAGRDVPEAARRHFLLLMPIANAADPQMQRWAEAEGLLSKAHSLPALMKPYFDLDVTRTSLADLKNIIAYLLQSKPCLHDATAKPVAIAPCDIDIYIDWACATPDTPDWLLQEPLPQPYDEALNIKKDYSLLSVLGMLIQQNVTITPTIDFVYCRRVREH